MTGQLVLTFEIRCPRGGHPMRLVQTADPKGWAHRERRAVVQCTVPHCAHSAVVEVHLVDIQTGNPAGAARKRRQRARATQHRRRRGMTRLAVLVARVVAAFRPTPRCPRRRTDPPRVLP